MEAFYDVFKFLHIISFVFMSVPLFNLIVVNERAMMGSRFVYATDRYMENIIRRGASRCYVFQGSVLITGILLLYSLNLDIEDFLGNWVLVTKTILLFVLMGLLSYVHFGLQPKIESILAGINPDTPPPDVTSQLKPYRVLRKRLATLCLFIVISTIILGIQVYRPFDSVLNIVLFILAGLFAWRANKTLIRFGWV